MPQFRRRPRAGADPDRTNYVIRTEHNTDLARKSIDVGEDRVRVRAQINRLGHDHVRQVAERAGMRVPSSRTLRRWGQQNRIPDDALAELLRRADVVARAGGVQAAARAWGRSTSTIQAYLRNPKRDMRTDAKGRAADTDRADRWTAAGIPHDGRGNITRPAWINVRGKAHVTGATPSSKTYAYTRNRSVSGYQLDLPTTQSVMEARDRGDEQAAIEAIEKWLGSDAYAGELEGWSADHGWKWLELDELSLDFGSTTVGFYSDEAPATDDEPAPEEFDDGGWLF